VLTTDRDALWATRRAPHTEPRRRTVRSSIASTIMFVLALLLAVATAGVLVLFGQPEVAAEVCEQHPLCATCVSCASAEPHPCAPLRRACDDDADCFELSECVTACLGSGADLGLSAPPAEAVSCIETCRDAHGEGREAWCRFATCAFDEACALSCSAEAYRALTDCS
ncbi:MAG: hypothetical protein AAF602_21130, partial [Myxococcota bacterium]